jgi:hypothetical protein
MKIVGTINEIGDSTKAVPYSIRYGNADDYDPQIRHEGKFKLNGLTYIVELGVYDLTNLDVAFGLHTKGLHPLAAVDKGLEHAFKVMATVVAMTKEVIMTMHKKHGYSIETITFGSSAMGKAAMDPKKKDQRTKLYTAFIKKALPGAKIHQSLNHVEIQVPMGIYK